MTRLFAVAVLCTSAVLLVSGGEGRPQVEVRTVEMTHVIRIPLTAVGSQETSQASGKDSAILATSPGAAEELPEGPDGFDILDDGGILISDPLRNRVVTFDSQGKLRQSWNIGFAADSIRILPDGRALIREANTGQLHAFDREGKTIPGEVSPPLDAAQAQKLTATSGSISNGNENSITVHLERVGQSLVSLQCLAVDNTGKLYVALESTSGESTEGINVNKTVRKYAANGNLLSESTNLPLNYYIRPVDELRVRKGKIYQLMTTSSEVEINIWDMN